MSYLQETWEEMCSELEAKVELLERKLEIMSERHKKTELKLKDCKDFHATSVKHRNQLLEEIATLKQFIIDPQGDFKND